MDNDFNLKVRGADFDAAELYAQRMILRADIMAAAVDHVQAAYEDSSIFSGEKANSCNKVEFCCKQCILGSGPDSGDWLELDYPRRKRNF